VPLGPILAAGFGLPVFVDNDGALFAYGGSDQFAQRVVTGRAPTCGRNFARPAQ